MAHYPADTFQEATEIAIEASNQLHGVINGDANAEVIVEDGSKIPSVRKAMVDSLYFKPPIAWAQGEYEDTYNQLREFVDGDVRTWWFAKGATVSTPVLMTTNPAIDVNWTLWSAYATTPSAEGKINTASNLGAGVGLYKQKIGVDLQFKTLSAGTNCSLDTTTDTDRVIINVPVPSIPDTTIIPINSQTGTAYTLSLTDKGYCVEMNNASANTLTIPPNSSVAFAVGTTLLIRQMGIGNTTVSAGSGVTIRNPHLTLKLAKQYATASLHKRGTDEWCVDGNMAEAYIETDPYWTSVVALLHGNELLDSSSHALILNNHGATINTSIKKYGSGSLYFNGANSYITSSAITALNLGVTFTIEFYLYLTSTSTQQYFVELYNNIQNRTLIQLNSNGTLSAYIIIGNSYTNVTTSSAPPINTWIHVSLVRIGTIFELYIDGISVGSATISSETTFSSNPKLNIGYFEYSNINYLSGYIDDLRITNGIARYTSNFTPPTSQFPDG